MIRIILRSMVELFVTVFVHGVPTCREQPFTAPVTGHSVWGSGFRVYRRVSAVEPISFGHFLLSSLLSIHCYISASVSRGSRFCGSLLGT